jgi:hypothetical protein
MNPRPTALELLTAAREHFAQRVLPTISDPQLKFQTLVAVHVLGVVERELTAGPDRVQRPMLRAYRSLLGRTGAEPDDVALASGLADVQRDLCAAIQSGAFDDAAKARALADTLTAMVSGSLQLWNPAFLARVGATAKG